MHRTSDELHTIANVASTRAGALREHAARTTSPRLEPLRRALHIRAGELELAAAVLGRIDGPTHDVVVDVDGASHAPDDLAPGDLVGASA